MYGHLPLIELRKQGYKPRYVFINDMPSRDAKDWHDAGAKHKEKWPMDHVTICTHGDHIALLDMRFLVGLSVSISATDEKRARSLIAKAKQGGADVVGAGVVDSWSEVWRKEHA